MFKKVSLFLTVLLIVVAMAGFAYGKITLDLLTDWGPDSLDGWLYNSIQKYNKENPNLHINFVSASDQDMTSKLNVGLAAGAGSDIIRIMNAYGIKELARNGWLAPAPPFVLEDLENNWDKDASMGTIHYGTSYGYPAETISVLPIVNPIIYDEAGLPLPDSYQEMAEQQEKLTKRDSDGNIIQAGILMRPMDRLWAMVHMSPIIWGYGADWLEETDKGTRAAFNTPGVVEGLEVYKTLTNKELLRIKGELPAPYTMIPAGKCAGMLGGIFYGPARVIAYGGSPEIADRIKALAPPKGADGVRRAAAYFYTFVVNANSSKEEQEEAWKFLAWLNSEEVLWEIVKKYYIPLARKDHLQRLSDDEWVKSFIDAWPYAREFCPPEIAEIEVIWHRNLVSYIIGELSAQEMLNRAEKGVNEIYTR